MGYIKSQQSAVFNSLFDRQQPPSLELIFDGRPLPPEVSVTSTGGFYVPQPGLSLVGPDELPIEWGRDDGGVWKPRGGLVMPGYTNQLLDSEDFSAGGWVRLSGGGNSLAGGIVSLDPQKNSQKFIARTNDSAHRIYYVMTGLTDSIYNFSVFAKAGELTKLRFYVSSGLVFGGKEATFSLTDGSKVAGNAGAYSEYFGEGWYRLNLPFVSDLDTSQLLYLLYLVDDANQIGFVGDGISGLYIWGAQVTQTPSPMPYTPTSGAAVTVASTALSINLGKHFVADSGTIYLEFIPFNYESWIGGTSTAFWLADTVNTGNRIQIRKTTSSPTSSTFEMAVGRNSTFDFVYTNLNEGSICKCAFSWSAGTLSVAFNGVADEVFSPVMSALRNTIYLGSRTGGSSFSNCLFRKIGVYPTAFPESQLVALTS